MVDRATPLSAGAEERIRAVPSRPALGARLAYGFGSVAYGVKDNGFDYFLLLFYSAVIGVDARLVGLAITIALIFDALSDPLVGYWSDNFRSKWGRRHPFMYAAAIPVALSYFLLWTPPAGWSDEGLFWYLLILAILIRTFITVYETPSTALAPELTSDYDKRSELLGLRYYFGWTGGTAMAALMFFFLFPAFSNDSVPDGRFNPESYALYGVIASLAMFAAIMVSAIGTHGEIARLKAPPEKRTLTPRAIFGEIFETLCDRSFFSVFGAWLFVSVAKGLSAGLAFYFYTYFWEFSSLAIGGLTIGVFLSAAIGLVLAPIVTRRIGKKRGAIIIGLIAFLGAPLPIFLRVIGVLPENGDPFVYQLVLVTNIIDLGLIICFQILMSSMIADLVEASELKTGRRSEGLFSAAVTFIRKSVQGFGLITASFVLHLARFPEGAGVDEVPEGALWRLGAYFVPTILTFWMISIAIISTYRIDRFVHEENLRRLAARASGASGADMSGKA